MRKPRINVDLARRERLKPTEKDHTGGKRKEEGDAPNQARRFRPRKRKTFRAKRTSFRHRGKVKNSSSVTVEHKRKEGQEKKEVGKGFFSLRRETKSKVFGRGENKFTPAPEAACSPLKKKRGEKEGEKTRLFGQGKLILLCG